MTSRVVLIGVGNPWRSDDGIGWEVAEAARQRLGEQIDVVRTDGEPGRMLDAWSNRDVAIVVDALRSTVPPGTVRVWDGFEHAAATPSGAGSHDLGISHAIALGRALDRLPARLVIVGVEVTDTSPGQGLSPKVAAAVGAAVDAIAGVVQAGSKATSSADE